VLSPEVRVADWETPVKRLVFLHTMVSIVAQFTALAREVLPPDVESVHIVDEILLRVVLAEGRLTPFVYQRVCEDVVAAERAGAHAVQLTCSSISPCADVARTMVSIPVLKVDEPMIDRALSMGGRIGVIATASTTLKPTTDLVKSRAQMLGKLVKVEAVLCDDAYAAFFSGDLPKHDRIVLKALTELMPRNDVILLAQASMARVAEANPPQTQFVPILSSPRLAVERARQVLSELDDRGAYEAAHR